MSSKILVIVESPGKIKKIQNILGSKYIVVASVGHIIDLNPKNKSIDISNKYEPIYVPISRQVKTITQLKKLYKTHNNVLLAADEDREGEMIAWSIAHVLKIKNPKRIVFNSITKKEILDAVKKPHGINQNMVNAQKARRVLDRLVGYDLSPLLWKNIQAKLSAGRVQSVVVKLIVEKENDIKNFFSTEKSTFYKFIGNFMINKNDKLPFKTVLYNLTKKDKGILKGNISKITEEKDAHDFIETCIKSKFIVDNTHNKTSFRSPSSPFTTSTLQQEASRKLGFSIKRTMMAAQNLYEQGYITYMRTDSVNLSSDALDQIKDYVINNFGQKYYNKRLFKAKSKNTQEAHEAVRPTKINVIKPKDNKKIGDAELRLYSLIWKRTVASQMQQAEFKLTVIQISISKNNKYYFSTTLEKLIFPGYLKIYKFDSDEEDENENNNNNNTKIPESKKELFVENIIGTEEYEKPPSRYTEASLVDKLDPKNLNIGRPSTYGAIITKIQERGYVKKDDIKGISKKSTILIMDNKRNISEEKKEVIIGQDNNKFVPTCIGTIVNDYLERNFPKVMNYKFTANMEQDLDYISEGSKVWHKVIDSFYKEFKPKVDKLMKSKVKETDKFTRKLGKDPKSGYDIIATVARYGPIVKLLNSKTKPLIAPIRSPLTLDTIKLSDALELFQYPKNLGKYDGNKVILNRGKYGLYLTIGTDKYSISKDIKEKDIDMKMVEKIVKEKKKNILAEFITDKKIYRILEGPYGKYINVKEKKKSAIKKKKLNVKLPEKIKIKDLTLEKVEEIIDNSFKNKYKKKTKGGSNKTTAKKTTAKKTTAKKTTAKKTTAKKTTAKKTTAKKTTAKKTTAKKTTAKKTTAKKTKIKTT